MARVLSAQFQNHTLKSDWYAFPTSIDFYESYALMKQEYSILISRFLFILFSSINSGVYDEQIYHHLSTDVAFSGGDRFL